MPNFATAAIVQPLRDASRSLVRELGFMKPTLAGTELPPSAVHALIEIEAKGMLAANELSKLLDLEKSSVSRLVRKLIDAGELSEEAGHGDARFKSLFLTAKGRATARAINVFANAQVEAALARLKPEDYEKLLHGVRKYADALRECRTGVAHPMAAEVTIDQGYRTGVIARSTEMHALYYARMAGFGAYFESTVALGLAEFVQRLDRPKNGLWSALENGRIVGTIAIDGEDLGSEIAHLRWFIVDDGLRGRGTGRQLLGAAVGFSDARRFKETHLWTFAGLSAARHLYEAHGFVCVEERPGTQWGAEVMEQRFVRART
jgi:DNA-binding MarR family transcriptional regulator/N-acetylglutamate synthase-like GNAT family acetyltransferase